MLQSAPLQKGFIRGSSILSGYYVQKKGEGLSLTYVSQVDLKGNAALILFKIVLIFFVTFTLAYLPLLICIGMNLTAGVFCRTPNGRQMLNDSEV